MGLFKSLKKAFKKVTGFVKKNIKRVVKFTKKQVKRIKSSKILKALALAAVVIVTGGAALGAMGATTGAGLFGSTVGAAAGGTGFAGWMTGTAASITGSSAIAGALSAPFTALGSAIGSTALALGVPAISNAAVAAPLTSASVTAGLNLPTTIPGATAVPGATSSVAGLNLPTTIPGASAAASATGTAAQQLAVTVPASLGLPAAEAASTGFFSTKLGGVVKTAATVGGTALLNAGAGALAAKYVNGEGDTVGGEGARAAYEGAEVMDPLQVHAAKQGINTDDIYSHMMYGNQDPSTQYSNQLYQQQTFGVA